MSVTTEIVQLPIDCIRIDGGTQVREELNLPHVDELVEVLQEGNTFKDPITVFFDGSTYWPGDGFHRIFATQKAGITTIDAEVKQGTLEDAIEYSCGANATHGLRRTNGDKRNAVIRLLSLFKWQNKSNREIARQCGVTEGLVRIVRSELSPDHPAYHPRAYNTQNDVSQPIERNEANERVGNSPSLEDRRNKVKRFFEETPNAYDLSNREVARQCGVDHKTVAAIRDELYPVPVAKPDQGLWGLEENTENIASSEVTEPEPIKTDEPDQVQVVLPAWRGLDETPEQEPQDNGFTYAYCTDCDEIIDDWKPAKDGWECGNCGEITLTDDMQIRETQNRYDGSKPATCKYCYQTHNQWESAEEGWGCRKCGYVTADEFMEIEGVEPSKEQEAFYQRYNDIVQQQQSEQEPEPETSMIKTEQVDAPEPQQTETEIDEEPETTPVARNAPAIEQDIEPSQIEKATIPQGLPLIVDQSTESVENDHQISQEEIDAKESNDAHVMRVMGSSDSPEWYTPQDIIDRVCRMFGTVDTDPCSNSHETPAVPASTLYTKDDDGLSQTWTGRTYLNPPYGSEISLWTDKLIAEYKRGNVEEALALLPARIDTVWFSPLYEYLMCNVKGRIQFANSPYHAPFPCVIVYLGTRFNDFIEVFKNLGPIMRRIA